MEIQTAKSRAAIGFSTLFKGVAQIFLQQNTLTGLFFFAGLLCASRQAALGALLGSAVGAMTAMIVKANRNSILAGHYGFSSALVGAAVCTVFNATPALWFIAVLGAVAAALLQFGFNRFKIPGLTFPFVAVLWSLIFLAQQIKFPGLAQAPVSAISLAPLDVSLASLRGFGQVIFQGGAIAGLLFFVGVFVSKPLAALYGLAASCCAIAFGLLMGLGDNAIIQGIWGFNPVLTAIALTGERKRDGAWVFVGVCLTFALQYLFSKTNIFAQFGGYFTFPFIAAVWLILPVQKMFSRIAART